MAMFDAWYPGEKLKCHTGYQVFFSINILLSPKYYLEEYLSAKQKATAQIVSSCSNTVLLGHLLCTSVGQAFRD